jgi:16S rRNA (uracil1498-N3)-methyltransferase
VKREKRTDSIHTPRFTFHHHMHRFYLAPEQCRGATLTLTGSEAHHASRVLRLRRGDEMVVLDGAGTEFSSNVAEIDRHSVQLSIRKKNVVPQLPYQITLLQAVPKGKILESIIQKATELGVARVVPLLTERVTTRLEGENAAHKAEKLQHVAIEAIKQCGSAWLPKIETPVTPKEFLSRGEKFDLALIASLQPGSVHAREYFQKFYGERQRKPQTVCIWIGPEGDFTADEVRTIEAAGALPITLGRLVLRVETAAIYCLSILNHELQAKS